MLPGFNVMWCGLKGSTLDKGEDSYADKALIISLVLGTTFGLPKASYAVSNLLLPSVE